MPSAPPMSVVVRALAVLRAMNQQPVVTLLALHEQTGIPKPSLSRILQTLESEGLIRHAKYGSYYLTAGVTALANGYHSVPRIVDASRDVADALTRELTWPAAIATPLVDEVVVRYTTTKISPLSFFHSPIGMRLSMVNLALGRAYLAFLPDDAQESLIQLVLQQGRPSDGVVGGAVEIARILRQVRERGYATRDPQVRPESTTLAVPIFEGNRVVASMGLTWFSKVIKTQQGIETFLPPLLAAAKAIGGRLADSLNTDDPADAAP